MPSVSGLDVVREIQNRHAQEPWLIQIRLIMVSGGLSEEETRALEELGVTEHLLKPVTMGTLRALLFC